LDARHWELAFSLAWYAARYEPKVVVEAEEANRAAEPLLMGRAQRRISISP